MDKISQYTGLPYIDIKQYGTSIEDFVSYIKNATFVISDSFHASCFSTIFHKPFVTIDEFANDARFRSLADIAGLHNHFVPMKTFDYSRLDLSEDKLSPVQVQANSHGEILFCRCLHVQDWHLFCQHLARL